MSIIRTKDVEKPYLVIFVAGLLELTIKLARMGHRIGVGSEAANFRKSFSFLKKIPTYFIAHVDETVAVENRVVDGVKIRTYYPKVIQRPLPIMMFYHGGGFVFGSVETYDLYLAEFVKQLNMIVVSVDYRLSPEFPYPVPLNDSYTATKYVINHPDEFKADLKRLVLAGDSAGGNIVAVLTQRLLEEVSKLEQRFPMPKLQILIYPWTQLFSYKLPSNLAYGAKDLCIEKCMLQYMGVKKVTKRLLDEIKSNNHTCLLEDQETRAQVQSILDISNISEKYKAGRSYYDSSDLEEIYPDELSEKSKLVDDSGLANMLKRLADPDVSPLLAPQTKLTFLPKAYFIILETDSLKDDGLLYAERLKSAGVDVDIAFYDLAFHGIVSLVSQRFGFRKAREIQQDLINYLRINL